MERFARVVLGYHGCRAPVAADLLSGSLSIEDWAPSENAHDWLGHGVYFWEHSPERALDWARRKVARDGLGEQPASRTAGRASPFRQTQVEIET
jgi:hypothetical protein